jgi:hypothetical protein
MTLRTVAVPAPAVGQDWRYIIPGQYVEDVVAVTATLVTLQKPTTAPDASGNGRPLTYTNNAFTTYSQTGPFAGSPNLAVNQSNGASGLATQIGTRAPSTDWNLATLSVGGFIKCNGTAQGEMWTADNTLGFVHHGWRFDIDASGGDNRLILQWKAGGAALNLGTVAAGWHLVGVTYDGANVRGYIDGVLQATVPAAASVDAVSEPMGLGGYGDNTNNFPFKGSMAGWFVNAGVLSAARWLAYYTAATGSGSAAYKAAVLADSPMALWLLDDAITSPSRNATLEITDGTNLVGVYPGGTLTGSAPAFTWTWSVDLPSGTQGPNAQVTTVAIPRLVLPAGYTIGTRTADLAPTDQWSGITVWWDDTVMDTAPDLNPYVYAPGATLVYQQIGGST